LTKIATQKESEKMNGKYVVWNRDKGFLCENEDTIGDDFDFELDEYTVTFSNLEMAKKYCEKGDIVLKVEYQATA
jgi:hypothetical protein